MNKLLSIVIPTFNRAEFLDYSLKTHIPICKKYNVEIFISDNASTDNTEEIVKKWEKEYKLLSYYKNESNIGPDANFEKALRESSSDYIWLLSDTYIIEENSLNYVLNSLENNSLDLLVLNLSSIIKVPTQVYTDGNKLLYDLGAIMTCAAINIYNKELINKGNFIRYYDSSFIQTGIIFEFITNRDFKVQWCRDFSVKNFDYDKLTKSNWSGSPKVFDIACIRWTNFVMSLSPSYKLENKLKCIMDFGKVSGLFKLKSLMILRSNNLLNIKTFSKYKYYFKYTIDYPLFFIFLISIFPRFFVNFILKVKG